MNHPTFFRCSAAMALIAAVCAMQTSSHAQTNVELPKIVTLVVPQAPGGSNDAMGRAIAARLPKVLNSSFIVDNRQGANGNVGMAWVAKTAPRDGSVWLITINSTLTINSLIYNQPGFDTATDFAPVAGIAVVPHVLLTKTNSPVNSLKEVIDYARKDPAKYSYGSSGNGTFSHLLMEQMKQSQKVSIAHIPYRGVAPAMADLIGGQVQYVISTLPAALPFIKSGQLKALAITSLTRSAVLPNVPLANDTVPGMVADLWIAMYASKGTPQPAIDQMHTAVAKVLDMPDMQSFLAAQGAMPLKVGPVELGSMTAAEMNRWTPIVKITGLKID